MLGRCGKEVTILADKVLGGGSSKWGSNLYQGLQRKPLRQEVLPGLRDLQGSQEAQCGLVSLEGVPAAHIVTTSSDGQRQAGQHTQSDASTQISPRHQGLCASLA